MPLSPVQLATLKVDILANLAPIPAGQPWSGDFAGTLVKDVPNSGDGNVAVAGWYTQNAAPSFWVWRTSMSKAECTNGVGPEATTFTWVGNGFITRSVGEQTAWAELFSSGAVNPSLANVRQAFSDIFSGTGNAASNRTHLLAVGRRLAKYGEKLFAVGTGSTGSPAVMGFEGSVSAGDVNSALNLP